MLKFFKSEPFKHLTDEELLARYRQRGGNRVLNALIDRYLHIVYGAALQYLKNQADAEDATMEIMGSLGPKLRKYDIQNFSSWLYAVVNNHCYKTVKKRAASRTEDIDENNEPGFMEFMQHNALLEREAQFDKLSDAIDELNPEQRLCITAFYLQQKTYKQIASELGYTENQVKSYIQNGKRNLRTQIAKWYESQTK